ncbi:factor-independent urate hydroxylase [Nonomuraea jiangxiensis]|uniref:Uricase n=1 Tax=Nonomuraea jiangxiensis TaxID=633440 RepID=A0A1G8H781_9ACTN|nr:urate oxidase [Nonomuraea jiangxiensis]SDI02517.1 urate oxidase [Nonomuraea jiangxiensis]
MSVKLGPNRYGKAETRLVRVVRDGPVHHLKDLNVSTSLSGDMEAAHLTGDNAAVLPTDTQKNTAYALAARHGVGQIEEFALLLARHFVESQPTIHHARVQIEEFAWNRRGPHSFVRDGSEVRTCVVHHDADGRATVVSGLTDLVVLNSAGSEFHGYLVDEYTTLRPTDDRILATSVTARWRHTGTAVSSYGTSYDEVRRSLLEAFADTHSLSLQQTLYAMGERALTACPEICEVRLTLPNRHHFPVDLSPFGLDNDNEVFHVADRPYGLIEGAVLREDAPDAGFAWE